MAEPLLIIEGLSFTWPDGTPALDEVGLRVQPGERIALIGPNGSGKSTLLLCIMGLVFGRGRVRLGGIEVVPDHAKALRGRVGLVFQSADDQLFMPTLADDLAFGPRNLGLPENQVEARVREVAGRMGLIELLGRPPHHLSMGQRRSAAIAGVLAMNPDLLLMDEPASNLDPRSRRRLIEALRGLSAAMIIASHDLAMVAGLCSRAVLIDGGRVVADRPIAELLSDGPLLEAHGLEGWRDSRP